MVKMMNVKQALRTLRDARSMIQKHVHGHADMPDQIKSVENWLEDTEQLARIGLQAAQHLAHKTATEAGWYRDPATGNVVDRNFGEVVALMHSELSEALEADRKGLMDDKLPHRPGQEVEFADCVIRIMDTCAARGYDLAGAIIEKNRFNKDRADHKLENRAVGGKRY